MERRQNTSESYFFPGNREALEDFEGLTPDEMHGLLHFTFDEKRSPLVFDPDAGGEALAEVRLVKDVTAFLDLVRQGQPVKLTQKGNLPRKLCREIIDAGLLGSPMEQVAFREHPIQREADSHYIHYLNLLCGVAGLTRKSKGKLRLTRKAEDLAGTVPGPGLYRVLFEVHTRKLNWAYFDRYPESWIIQAGFGFTIRLVQLYGDVSRKAGFYCDRFLKAFPVAMDELPGTGHFSGREDFDHCYLLRSFDRFMVRFGLAEVRGDDFLSRDKSEVVKTDLVDRMFRWKEGPGPEGDPFFNHDPAL
jgi:hypothetical protein